MSAEKNEALRLADELDGMTINEFYEALGDEAAADADAKVDSSCGLGERLKPQLAKSVVELVLGHELHPMGDAIRGLHNGCSFWQRVYRDASRDLHATLWQRVAGACDLAGQILSRLQRAGQRGPAAAG